MASLIVISWRDVPAQVVVKRGRETAKVQLSQRFQEAVDRRAIARVAAAPTLTSKTGAARPPNPVAMSCRRGAGSRGSDRSPLFRRRPRAPDPREGYRRQPPEPFKPAADATGLMYAVRLWSVRHCRASPLLPGFERVLNRLHRCSTVSATSGSSVL